MKNLIVVAVLCLFTGAVFGTDADVNGLEDAYDTWASGFTNGLPEEDEDADGTSNLFEYIAGTPGDGPTDPDPGQVTALNYGFLIAIFDEGDAPNEEQESSQFDWLATFQSGTTYDHDADGGTTPEQDYSLYYPELVIDCNEQAAVILKDDPGTGGYGYETAVYLTADNAGTPGDTSDDFYNQFNRTQSLRASGSYGGALTEGSSGEYARGFIAFNGTKYQGGAIVPDASNVAAEAVLPGGATGVSAMLRLYMNRTNNTPKVHIYAMPNPWLPHTMTHTEAFAVDLSLLTEVATNQAMPNNVPGVDARQWVDFDVTSAVDAWTFGSANTHPVITAFTASTASVEAGTPVTFTVTATDAQTAGAALQYFYDFDLADTIDVSTPGTASQQHSFSTPGTYYVGVQVADEHGGFAYSAVGTITVTAMVDTDGDGLSDTVETDTGTFVSLLDTGTDPALADTDGDGMEDLWESQYYADGFNPNTANAGFAIPTADMDNDGLTNLEESVLGTDPNSADSDGDRFTDAWEDAQGYDPLDGGDMAALDADSDGLLDTWELLFVANVGLLDGPDTDSDGLSDIREFNLYYGVDGALFGTAYTGIDPTLADSDADTYTDGAEVNLHGTDPTDALSIPSAKSSGSGGGGCVPVAGSLSGLLVALAGAFLLRRKNR